MPIRDPLATPEQLHQLRADLEPERSESSFQWSDHFTALAQQMLNDPTVTVAAPLVP